MSRSIQHYYCEYACIKPLPSDPLSQKLKVKEVGINGLEQTGLNKKIKSIKAQYHHHKNKVIR